MLRLNQFFIALYNAQVVGKARVSVPFSKHTWECAQALMHFGFLHSVRFTNPLVSSGHKAFAGHGVSLGQKAHKGFLAHKRLRPRIECVLKYQDASPLIRRVVLLSTPSRRLSWDYPTVRAQSAKPGNFLLLTHYGVLTETEALHAEIGGLPLCRIFLHPWKV